MNSLKLLHTIRKYGTSYAIATAFFPKLVRDRVLLLYSFVRYPDNIVDQDIENLNQEQKREHYQRVKQELEKQFEDRKTEYQA
jgi:phytoene/squalene synthetase